jgi:hypothetical protein
MIEECFRPVWIGRITSPARISGTELGETPIVYEGFSVPRRITMEGQHGRIGKQIEQLQTN